MTGGLAQICQFKDVKVYEPHIKAKIFKKITKMHYKEIFEIKHLKCLSEIKAIFMAFYNSLWMGGEWWLMLLLMRHKSSLYKILTISSDSDPQLSQDSKIPAFSEMYLKCREWLNGIKR